MADEGQDRLQPLRVQGTVGAITAWSLREFSRITGFGLNDVVRMALDDWVLSQPRYLIDRGIDAAGFREAQRRLAEVVQHPNANSDRSPGG